MARRKSKKAFKGLGAKYGSSVRKRYTRVVTLLKKKRQCPSCGGWKFKREAIGIWKCYQCNYTVAGGAYDIQLQQT